MSADAGGDRLERLRAALPDGALIVDPEILSGYEADITGRYGGRAAALARPRDRDEVAAVVAACAAIGMPLVPQGGNTGLVGGGVPRDGEVVLSLTGLDWVGEVDTASNQVSVGAGATLERVQEAARRAGLEFPLDHPARASATIGGGVATDAGGAPALRHGTMRRRVVGLEVVLADGGVVSRMEGLLKDNAGFDLPALLVGSEGTLGVITAVRLQLEPAAGQRLAALFGVGGYDQALELLGGLRAVPGLEAADFFDAACMTLVRERRALPAPLAGEHGLYVIAQCAGRGDFVTELAEALEPLSFEPEVAVAESTAERERLWAYRELLNESIREEGVPHKLDIAVPIARLPEFAAAATVAAGDARLFLYGHLGDGNVHVNLLGPGPDDDGPDERILRLATGLGGTISAEHGVGVAKRRYLSLCRSERDIAAMRALKRALDPDGILAPGRVLD
ncbi:MAG: FAD-binding oxidoreductase [Solirubrobacterales bacterium]